MAVVISLQKTYQEQADALQRVNDCAGALAKYDLVIEILDRILKFEPGHARAFEDRHFAAIERAEILTTLSRLDDAFAEWDKALKYSPTMFVELVHMNRTRTVAWTGKHRQATEQADAILERQPSGTKLNRHLLLASALTFAVAAQVALREDEDEHDNAESKAQSELYAKRSVELLGSYKNAGGSTTNVLDNRDLQFLAVRSDFQALKESTGPQAK